MAKCSCLVCILLSESNDSCFCNIKSNCQKENICADKQFYSSFYSCGTAHFDGSYPYNSWYHSCYLCISFCCCLKFGCPCFMANLGCRRYHGNN
uniref:Uncharacterized protein n=1 Tax=Arundo donax TaxID=35708 RepID=A0A0A9CW34_ARUDO